jgi:hypothetical protein
MKVSCILFAATLIACQSKAGGPNHLRGFVESKDDHFALWPDPNNIPVCWVDDYAVRQDYKEAVYDIAVSEFARAGLYLTGWKICDPAIPAGQAIKIKIHSTMPFGVPANISDLLGTRVARGKGIVYLNHHAYWDVDRNRKKFPNHGGKLLCVSKNGMNCVRSYALHEIAHAIGLHHEGSRGDENCNITSADPSENEQATMIGDYDPKSATNYCKNLDDMLNDVYPSLSDGDLAALDLLYFGPLVRINARLNSTEKAKTSKLDLAFTSIRATEYRYRIGKLGEIDCKDPHGYSGDFSLTTTQAIDISESADDLVICALGKNKNSEQPAANYSATTVKRYSL